MLKLENINYRYNEGTDKTSICNLNIEISRKECILLCGRSGSGKTTVTKLINSLIPNYYDLGNLKGRVQIEDLDTQSCEIYEVSRLVSSVFQNPKTQFFNINTSSEILFYLENRGYDREFMKEKLEETARIFGIQHLLNRNIFELSGGEKQIIAIASAFASGADIILLDEPSSNLDHENTKLIGNILAKLKELGKTIIISEHRFYYIKDIIDRIYYIDNGRISHEFTNEEFFSLCNEERIKLGLRSINYEELSPTKQSKFFLQKKLNISKIQHNFKNTNRGLRIDDKSYNFGSIIGVYGHNGTGKSTFIRILIGLEKTRSKIFINDVEISTKRRLKKSYLVMQDVNHQLFTENVETECILGKSDKYNCSDVERVLHQLNIYDLKELHPMSLSGGQKQRVAVAGAILSGAEIICFDEPTSGMDFDNMMRISQLIKDTINDDIIIFIISHDHEFLNRTVDEILDISKYNVSLNRKRGKICKKIVSKQV